MDGARAAWAQMSPALRAEAAQVLAAAGREVRLSAASLKDFDSSALSLLLSAARQCGEQGATLKLDDAPDNAGIRFEGRSPELMREHDHGAGA